MSLTDPIASQLLAPLSPAQQNLVDLLAASFVERDFEWPFYQYVEWMLDDKRLEAWAVLQSFPQIGRWGYGSVSWVRSAPGMKPSDETEICLTLVGMAHSQPLREYVDVAFAILDFMAERRKRTRPDPRAVTDVVATSDGFHDYWSRLRRLELPHPRLTYQLLEREPGGSFGSRSFQPDTGTWSRSVSRDHLDYAQIRTINDYVARLRRWLIDPQPAAAALSAPALSLPAAIDHLDDVWRIAFGKRLFDLRGAERIASLVADVNSRDEFDARVSVLCDLFRTAMKGVHAPQQKKERDRVLAPLAALLKDRLPTDAWPRIDEALDVLEALTAMRDSGQHAGASYRSVDATTKLGINHPIVDWAAAWQIVSARTVDALGAIRDELRSTTD